MDMGISSSAVPNIFKRVREFVKISVHKRQGQKSIWNGRDL